jgi:leucyl-tRNA synthetase
MGKSLKNIVTPDDMYAQYGADTFRLYEMGMGPLDQSKPWETRAIVGSQRFLQRVWRNVVDEESGALRVIDEPMDAATERAVHKAIDAVATDYAGLSFNTAIARLTELNNALTRLEAVPREAAEKLVLMVAPMAPHIAEELWARLGHAESLVREPFPVATRPCSSTTRSPASSRSRARCGASLACWCAHRASSNNLSRLWEVVADGWADP